MRTIGIICLTEAKLNYASSSAALWRLARPAPSVNQVSRDCQGLSQVQMRTGALLPRRDCPPWSHKAPRSSAASGDGAALMALTIAAATTSGVSRVRVSPCRRLAVLTVSPMIALLAADVADHRGPAIEPDAEGK